MDQLEHRDLKKRSFISTMSLFFQSGYTAVLGLVANLIVTILLSPKIFGIYITVLSIIALLNYFSDFGLAASIIQKKELSKDDIKTTFTIQQLLVITLVTIGFIATHFVTTFYKLPADGIYLYWALLAGFFLSSLKTIPSVFLERKIQFQKIVLVQIVENTVFYGIVSFLAIAGFGLQSFTIAVLFRSVVGLILIYILSPWKPVVGISRPSMKTLLSYGLPFQASSFLALFKDDLLILFLGKVLGFELLGYIGWAKKWADAPLRIVMDNVNKVLFPLISRVQDDKEKLKNISERLLYYQTSLLAPIIFGMMLTIHIFVRLIPNYAKWEPALTLYYILAVSSFILSFSAPFMNLYSAIGKVKKVFYFMLLITIETWVFVPILTMKFSTYGFPVTHLIASVSLGVLLFHAKRLLNFNLWRALYRPAISTLLMVVVVLIFQFVARDLTYFTLIISMLSGGLAYYVSMRYIFSVKIQDEIKFFLHPHA